MTGVLDNFDKKILLVEDDKFLATNEKNAMEQNGYHVCIVHSGKDAIFAVENDPEVKLILMDINLGDGMDGIETAEKILKTHDLPIVFLSSHSEKATVERTEKVSSYGYVLKNSGFPILDTSIKMAFRLHRANTKLRKSEQALRESEGVIRRKLDALLTPEGDIGSLKLSDIIDTEAIQDLMDEYYELTGIGVGIIDSEGKILVATGWQDICTRFHRVHPQTLKHCIESDTILTRGGEPGSFKRYKCRNNLWDISTPIMVGFRQIGNIFLGQFFFDDEEPDYEVFRNQARAYGFDTEKYIEALDAVPRWSHETVEHAMQFYSHFATLISKLSYGNLRLARTVEEHKQAEYRIQNLLHEKEVILNEVHHRIKNNLNTIESLLTLQLSDLDDPAAKNVLIDASGRVRSMMVLYNELYRSERKEAISLKDYLAPLVNEIIGIFPEKNPVRVKTILEDILLSPKMLTPLGILINELVTNSMKYAFSDRENGEITIHAARQNGNMRIHYHDNGPGLPEDVDFEKSPGFGLQLIRMLTKQLDGTVRIEREAGGDFFFEFTL